MGRMRRDGGSRETARRMRKANGGSHRDGEKRMGAFKRPSCQHLVIGEIGGEPESKINLGILALAMMMVSSG